MRAPQPEPPIPGSFATPSLLAWIVNGKYVMSLPLYRIEADLKACGATISRQDMANWMMNVHARWLAKVHERMKVELLSHVRIHADECISSSRCFVFSHVFFSGLGSCMHFP
ncbi:transposase, partial [Bifidobacterium longum]